MTFNKIPEPDWWTILYYAILVVVAIGFMLSAIHCA